MATDGAETCGGRAKEQGLEVDSRNIKGAILMSLYCRISFNLSSLQWKSKHDKARSLIMWGGGGGDATETKSRPKCSGKNGPDYEMYFVKRAKENKSHGGLNDSERKSRCSADLWRRKNVCAQTRMVAIHRNCNGKVHGKDY